MELYIEDFLIQQCITSFCLLRLVSITTKQETNWYKIFLGTVILTINSLVVAILCIGKLFYYLLNLASLILAIKAAFKTNIKNLSISTLLYIIFSLSIKGLILSLASSTIYSSIGIITYTKHSPMLILSLITIFTYIYQGILNSIKLRIKSNSLIHKMHLYVNNQKLTINAFIDTGNLLNLNGKGVVIIDFITYLNLINISHSRLIKTDTITLGTVNKTNNIPIFTLDKVEIEIGNQKKSYLKYPVGVTNSNTFKGYHALISPEMI